MSSSRVVRVHARDEVAAQSLRDGIATDPVRAQGDAGRSRPRSRRPRARAAAAPRLPDLDRTDLPFVTIDPASSMDLDQALHLEREGTGYVVHYAIADVAAFVAARRPGRRRRPPARRDAVRRRLQGPAAPDVALRGRRLAAARPGAPGPALDDPRRRHRRGHRRPRRAGPGAVDAPSSTTPASSRRSTTARADEVLQLLKEVGELRLAARGRARRHLAAAARAGGRRSTRRPVVAGVPLADPGRDAGTPRSRC